MSKKPWYFASSSIQTDTNLCQTCEYINFPWLLGNDFEKARYQFFRTNGDGDYDAHPVRIPWVSETANFIFPELSLGFLYEILNRRGRCSFCCLVCSSIATYYGIEPDQLLSHDFGAFPAEFVFCRLSSAEKTVSEGNSYDIVIDLTNIGRHFLSFNQIRLHRISTDVRIPYEGRPVASQIDFNAVKDWLSQFESKVSSDVVRQRKIPGFRVIDVLNKNVVLIGGPSGCRYLTLSYVWGGPQTFQNVRAIQQELQEPGSLSNRQLPATIQDAIDFTHAIGERYLWVDSLCIVQDDGDAKMEQIIAMDKIYNCAVAAIVALDGTSCYSGLPGVRKASARWKQTCATVRDIILANMQFISTAAGNCIWSTRGWTFQEHALSRRCIQFSRHGIQFESEDGVTWEDVYPPPHQTSDVLQEPTGIPVSSFIKDLGLLPNIKLYSMAVRFYSFRSLTFQNDALHAFEGVLNVQRHRFRREFLYGMPSSELELSMLWQPGSTLERRMEEGTGKPSFPSWTWVGWKGNLIIPLADSKHFSRMIWVDALDKTTQFTSDEWRGEGSPQLGAWKIVPNGNMNLAPWYFEEDNPNLRFVHPTSKDIPDAMKDRRFLNSESHVLHFHAHVAQIKSSPGNRSLEDPESGSPILAPGVKSHTLYDRFDRYCGTVYLHPQNPSFEMSIIECVAISRTAYGQNNASAEDPPPDDSDVVSIRDGYAERNEIRKKRDENSASAYFASFGGHDIELKWQAYNVLVIARGSDGVSERVGVGICLCEAFWDAAPRREMIMLK